MQDRCDSDKTIDELLTEIEALRARVAELESGLVAHRQTEEDLRQERDLLDRIMVTSPVGITVVDSQGQITFANSHAERVLGLTKDEITQRSYNAPEWNITDFDGNPFPDHELPFQKAMETGQPVYDVHHAIEWPEGDRVLLSINAAPLLEESGQMASMVATVQDISQQVRDREALEESEVKFRRLTEAAFEGVAVTEAGKFIEVSEQFAALFGYQSEELVGLSVAQVVSPEVREEVMAKVLAGYDQPYESLCMRKDGTVFSVEVCGKNFDAREKELRITAIRDISQRRQVEKALQQRAEELEALQATVLDITVPHDLPTLLETIVERAARLLDAPGGGLYICGPGQSQVECVVSYRTPSDYRGTVLQHGEGAAGIVAQSGEPLIIDDYRAWSERATAFDQEQPFRAVLAAPMIWQGNVIGVIDIFHDEQSHFFTQSDLDLLTLFANHAAIAVENTRLFEQAQEEIAVRRRLEQQGEERRRYLENLLACAPDAIVTLDAQHSVLEWNPGAEKLFGYSQQEAIGRDLDTLIAAAQPEMLEEACDFTQLALSGQDVPPTETIRYHKDGTPVHVILAGSPIFVMDELVGTVAVYTDITERKQAEEALRESEAKYRNIVESIPLGMHMYHLEPDGRLVLDHTNAAASQILGFDNAAFVGKTIEEVLPPLTQSEIPERYRGVASTGELWKGDQITYEDDRVSGIFEVHAFQTSPGRMAAAFLDITQRKQAEKALRRSEAQYRTTLNSMGDAIHVVNPDLRIVLANDALKAWIMDLGLEPEVEGQPVLQAFPFLPSEILKEYKEVFQSGRIIVTDEHTSIGDRAYITETRKVPIFEGDHVSQVITVVRDVTMRRQAEEELNKLKEFHESIVQNMSEGIAVQDADGFFTFLNPAAAELLGYDKEELVGEYWTKVVPPDQQLIVQVADERRKQGEADRYQVELLRKDGTRLPVLISGSPRFDARRFDGTLAVFTDISDRVQAEEKLARHAREMAALYETTLEINAQPDLSTLLRAIVRRASELVGTSMGGLYLMNPDPQELELVVSHNMPDAYVGTRLRLGEGLSGRIAQSAEPMMVADYSHWEGKAQAYEDHPFHRVLGVPLKVGDRVIGVINVSDDDTSKPFEEDEIRLVSLFADQAAIAVENRRLFEAEARRRREAETLQAVTQALSATLDLQQVFELILSELQQVVPYDSATIQQLEENRLVIIGGRGFPNLEELLGVGFDLTARDNPNQEVVRQRAPLILEDAPTIYEEFKREPHAQAGTRSWLGAPLFFGDQLIGMIALDKQEPGFYTEAHAQLAQAFAAQAAIAVENARLFEAASEQRDLAEALRQATAGVSSTLDLEQTLDHILEQVDRVIPSDAANVSLIEGNQTRIVRSRGYRRFNQDISSVTFHLDHTPSMRHMLETGEAIVIPDTKTSPGWLGIPEATWIQSYAGAPIRVRDEIIGFLNVDSATPGFFTQTHADRLQAFADEASLAVENARLFEETRRRAEQLAMLNRTGLAITSALELDEVLNTLYEHVRHIMDAGAFYVALYDEDSGRIEFPLLTGITGPGHIEPLSMHDQPGITGHIIQTGEPLYIPDTWSAQEQGQYDPIRLIPQSTRSYIGVPLHFHERVTGVLSVQSYEPHAYTEADLELLMTLSTQASIAIENARLFQAEREQRELAEALRRATMTVSSLLDLDQVLDEILKQVSRVVPVDSANIMLIEEEQARMVRWHGYDPSRDQDQLKSIAFCVADTPNLLEMQETGRAIVIPDTVAYPGWANPSPRVRSYAGAPIRIRDEVIGYLNVNKKTAGFFDQAHANRLQAFADQAGLAIGNARFLQIMERGKRDWEVTFDAMQDAVALVDGSQRVVRANRAFADLCKSALPQIVGQEYQVARRGESCSQDICSLEQALSSGLPGTCIHHYAGRVFEVQTTPVVEGGIGEGDSIASAIYALRDITDRMQAQEEIRLRNRELTLLNRVIAASAASLDIESILGTVCRELALTLDVPQSAAALLNDERTEARIVAEYVAEGRPSALGEIIPIEGNPSMQGLLEHRTHLVVDDARTDANLAPIRDLIDRRNTVSLLVLPLVVEDGVVGTLSLDALEPRAFGADELALAQRVAEQVSGALARTHLQETQRRLTAAVEQAAESILITDTQGNIVYVNPSFERVSGYSRDEAIGRKTRILKSGRHNRAFYRELWATISAGLVWQGRFINRKKNGTLYTEDSTITPVRDQTGEIVNYVAVNHDVTREVQLEEQFRRAQKMEALGQLAGGIAHDFNNLLTIIQLSIRLLQRQLHHEDPLWEHVQRIQETGQRAATLTKQLLSFSRREIIEPRVLNLNQVVGDLTRMLKRIIGEDIELVTALEDDLWSTKVDPTQVDQVILNLVINARDAMPQGGTLTIETSNAVLDEGYAAQHVDLQPGSYVLLSITDTGVGMEEETQAHIFEPFFTTKERGQGTGLGLAAVFGIVKQNKGHIHFYSKVGVGTTFKVYFPRAASPEDKAESRPLPPLATSLVRGTETILVVEDELDVLELTVRVLQACGYEVLTAGDGPEALEISDEHEGPIHLLITDVVMPRMYGKELSEQLQSRRPGLRLLFMSGYPDRSMVQQRAVTPGVAFLSKPFTVEELTQQVRAVLDDRL